MTKTTSKARKSTATIVKVAGTTVKATRKRRVKVNPVIAAPVAEVASAIEAVAETVAPAVVDTVFIIPDHGVTDLVIGREGFHQLPGKTWHRLSTMFGKDRVRQAIDVMVKLELRLPVALELVTWPSFRPQMVAQLQAVAANKDVLCVLEWAWNHQGWTWGEAYAVFPRTGFAGCKATRQEIGKFNKLVSLLDGLRKEGKTSVRGIDFVAQAAHLLGWIK